MSRVGSLANASHSPGGGNVRAHNQIFLMAPAIPNRVVDIRKKPGSCIEAGSFTHSAVMDGQLDGGATLRVTLLFSLRSADYRLVIRALRRVTVSVYVMMSSTRHCRCVCDDVTDASLSVCIHDVIDASLSMCM